MFSVFSIKLVLLSFAGGLSGFLYTPEAIGDFSDFIIFAAFAFLGGIFFTFTFVFDKGIIKTILNDNMICDVSIHTKVNVLGVSLINNDIAFILGTILMFVVHTVYSMAILIPISKISVASLAGIFGLYTGAWLRNKIVRYCYIKQTK